MVVDLIELAVAVLKVLLVGMLLLALLVALVRKQGPGYPGTHREIVIPKAPPPPMSQVPEHERRRRAWMRGFLDGVNHRPPSRIEGALVEHYEEGRRQGAKALNSAHAEAQHLYGEP